MSLQEAQAELLTTREASTVIGRSQAAVKNAINRGQLPGERQVDGWRVSRNDLLAWDARSLRRPRSSSRPWERAAELLEEWGPLSVPEVATLLERDEGNARKYLACLRKLHQVEQLPNGQWALIKRQSGAA
jgi:hypothetical protein